MAIDLDRLFGRSLGRREFLRYSAILGGAGVLAACQRAETPPQATGSPTGTGSPTPTRPPLEAEPGTLRIYDWAGYEVEDLWTSYAQKYPDKMPEFTASFDDDTGFTKIAAGDRTFDIVHPCGYRFQDWVNLTNTDGSAVIQPWDTSLIPSFGQLNPTLQASGVFNGQQYFVVTDWGFAAPMYIRGDVEPREDSWGLLWDDRYAGRVSWWDSPNMLVVGAYYHGFANPWDMTDDELAQMRDFLISKKDVVKSLWLYQPDLDTLFANGDVSIGYAWPASWAVAKGNGMDVVYMEPKEGRTSWFCGFALMSNTENYHHAHEYVDAWASAGTGLWLISNYYYGHTNSAVDLNQVDPVLVDAFSLDDPSVLQEPRTHPEIWIRRRDVYVQHWEEVKAA